MLHTALRQVDYNVKPFTETLISDTFEAFCTRLAACNIQLRYDLSNESFQKHLFHQYYVIISVS